jgi:thiol-disulfide isomerase/thioredoxin
MARRIPPVNAPRWLLAAALCLAPQQRAPLFATKADAVKAIAAAAARAKRENRRVLVEWGANWCSWCKMLQELFETDPKVRRTVLYEYEVVRVDVGRFDRNLELAASYGVDFTSGIGIPYLSILDADGKLVANQDTSTLERKEIGKKGHDPEKVLDVLARNQAPYLQADAVLAAALAAADADGKRVLVWFGAPGSVECRKFEAWTSADDVAGILGRDFALTKIDIERTVGGKELLKGLRKDEKKTLPWFAILDAQGSPIAISEPEGGANVGFPSDPTEIAHVGGMIHKAARRITDADIDAIARSLAEFREKAREDEPVPEPAPEPDPAPDPEKEG